MDVPAYSLTVGLAAEHAPSKQCVKTVQNGSAGGIDGLLPQHLKDMTCDSTGDVAIRLTDRLASLLTLMLSGRVPDAVCPVLYGASLTALTKKGGGIRVLRGATGRPDSSPGLLRFHLADVSP